MSTVTLGGGLFLGVVATGLVFADTKRRNLSLQTQYLWTGSAAIISMGAFLTVYLLQDPLFWLYLDITGHPALVPSPREVIRVYLSFASIVSILAVLIYGFGSRFGPLKAA